MRLFLFCKRPAVSAIKISMLRAAADCIASKITDAESEPVLCATTGILLRSPHTWSCSTAAARKVSPAANMTDLPSFWNLRANLPIVVVLPTPFTPTIKITYGFLVVSMTNGLATGFRISTISTLSCW